eukprot:TRINITY_DN55699_c0_g1_i1.p1 TRINITY_DN55699_c0_g1~~TRINITY_DN55699_c0_g1_i1.p1  ORF type:complete len:565 (-),score=116.81 TRINITY_DN55699_c0_g1_i1:70-1713(-)
MDVLCGAVFRGQLQPPDGESYPLSYRFDTATMDSSLPTAVKRQRQILRMSVKDTECITAWCDIPALGLEGEEVVVSADVADVSDGSRKLLLQSLARPDLGITLLRLASDGDELIGGDESWSLGEPPLVQARRVPSGRAGTAHAPRPGAGDLGYPPDQPKAAAAAAVPARPPQAAPAPGARRPQPQAQAQVRFQERSPLRPAAPEVAPLPTVVPRGPPIYHDPDSESEQEARRQAAADAEAARRGGYVAGGVGRSGMRFGADGPPMAVRAPKAGGSADHEEDQPPPRPDVAASAASGADAVEAAAAERAERLVAASAAGEIGDMRLLLARIGPEHPAPTGTKQQLDLAGLRPLMAAAARGRIEAIDLLLQKSAELEATDHRGWTALMHALSGERPAVVKRLLAARCAVAVPASNAAAGAGVETPLILAATGSRPELCKMILEARAHMEMKDSDGRRAIHHAARSGRGGALALLISARARVNDADRDGRTPLLLAAAAGRAAAVGQLLAARADAEARDLENRSAADLAAVAAGGNGRVLEVLASASGTV